MKNRRHNGGRVAGRRCRLAPVLSARRLRDTSEVSPSDSPRLRFRSRLGPPPEKTKPLKSAQALQRNYANEREKTKPKKRNPGKEQNLIVAAALGSPEPQIRTHPFVKYFTHLRFSREPGDLRGTSCYLVSEKMAPHTDTGTDNLACTIYV